MSMKRFLRPALPALVALFVVVVAACSAGESEPLSAGDAEIEAFADTDSDNDSSTDGAESETTVAADGASGDDEPAASAADSESAESDSNGGADADTADVPAFEPVSYNGDFGTSIQPLIAENCASCHNDGGAGSAHWQVNLSLIHI